MRYEKPELVLVDAVNGVVLGAADGMGDSDPPPLQLVFEGLLLGLDE